MKTCHCCQTTYGAAFCERRINSSIWRGADALYDLAGFQMWNDDILVSVRAVKAIWLGSCTLGKLKAKCRKATTYRRMPPTSDRALTSNKHAPQTHGIGLKEINLF